MVVCRPEESGMCACVNASMFCVCVCVCLLRVRVHVHITYLLSNRAARCENKLLERLQDRHF